jgi:hypothetical protein
LGFETLISQSEKLFLSGNELVVTVDDDGKIIMIAPEAVTLMEFLEVEPVVAGTNSNGE